MSGFRISDYMLFLKTHLLEHELFAIHYQQLRLFLERTHLFDNTALTQLYPELYCLDFIMAFAAALNADRKNSIEALIAIHPHSAPEAGITFAEYGFFLKQQYNTYHALAERHQELWGWALALKEHLSHHPLPHDAELVTFRDLLLQSDWLFYPTEILKSLRQKQAAVQQLCMGASQSPALPWTDLKEALNAPMAGQELRDFFDRVQQAYPHLHPILKSWLAAYTYPFPCFKSGARA